MSSKAVAQYEDRKQNIVVKNFGGVNLSAHRTATAEEEFAWLENLMPMGHANMPVLPAIGQTLAVPTAKFMFYANVGGVDYLMVVKADGSLTTINLNTSAITNNVLPAASLSTTAVAMAQWKNERVIIVDANNYRSVLSSDNLNYATGSVVAITMGVGGSGYTSVPAITFTGGSGIGVAAFANMQLNGTQAVVAGGSGYVVGDILNINNGGATFSVQAQVRVDAVGAANAVTALSVYKGGSYTVLPSNPTNSPSGGGSGTGASFTSLWNVASLTITNSGTVPYLSAPTVVFTGGGFSVTATATSTILSGPSGTEVASYSGRSWVGSGRTVNYSAPDSWFDFTAANAGGSFVMSDETLEVNVNQLVPANGFLYIVGHTSIDTLSDVRVVAGSPPITTFSRVNISAQIGSPFGPVNPLFPLGKSLLWSANFGVYSLLGSTPQKISKKLDLLLKQVTKNGSFLGGGVCKLYGSLCPAFLVSYPNGSVTTTLVLLLYEGKWFFANQGGITLLCEATVSGNQFVYASDGTNIYQLFGDTANATAISWKAITALWPAKSPVLDKQVLTCAVEVSPLDNPQVLNPTATTDNDILINVGLDNERGSIAGLTLENTGQWQNAVGVNGSWVNTNGAVGDFMIPGFAVLQKDAQTKGRYIGYTLTGSTKSFTINGILGRYEDRASWSPSGSS